jgi:hypothetical protein
MVFSIPVIAFVGYLADLGSYRTTLLLLFLLVCHLIVWLHSYATKPIKFEINDTNLVMYFRFNETVSIKWGEIIGIDNLGTHGSKNGFGAPELEVRALGKCYYIVKHLNNYSDFESYFTSHLDPDCTRGTDKFYESKKTKNNIIGAICCSVVGIIVFHFREIIPSLGGIDISQALIVGAIAGAATGFLTALGLINKDKNA